MPARPLDETKGAEGAQKNESQDVLTDFDIRMALMSPADYSASFPWLIDDRRLDRQTPRLSTGSTALDKLLDGGVGSRFVTDFYGPRSSGKTQLCFQIALNNSVTKRNTLFIDTLGSFRPERITQIAQNRDIEPQNALNGIFVLRCITIDQQLEITAKVREFLQKKRADLVIIDDISNNFFVAKEDATNIEMRSAFAQHLHEISHLATEESLMVVVTNSIRARSEAQGSRSTMETLSQIITRSISERIKLENRSRRMVATRSDGRTANYTVTEKGIEDW